MASKQIDLRRIVIEADPDWTRDRRVVPEYEFSNGRKFKADYTKRGAYEETEE